MFPLKSPALPQFLDKRIESKPPINNLKRSMALPPLPLAADRPTIHLDEPIFRTLYVESIEIQELSQRPSCQSCIEESLRLPGSVKSLRQPAWKLGIH